MYLLVLLFFSKILQAQLPKSDIYSFKLVLNNGLIELYNPTYLTNFNTGNYNNQVNCLPGNRISITAEVGGSEQTDILILNSETKTIKNITASDINEFSSTYFPLHRTWYFVTQDQASVQYLWEYPSGMNKPGEPLFPDIQNVGYYRFVGDMFVALFLVSDPHELKLYSRTGEFVAYITKDPGHSFDVDKEDNLYYIHKYNDTYWYLKKYNISTRKSEIVIRMLEGVEGFNLVDDAYFIAGKGSVLYKFNPTIDVEWIKIANLQSYDINNISRVSVCGDQLFLVNTIQ
jgi:hypothetical protein